MNVRVSAALLFALSGLGAKAWSQCTSLPPQTDFEKTEIAAAPGTPMDISVAKDGRVFWVERHGYFRMWDPTTKQTTLITKMSVLSSNNSKPGGYNGDVETGLEGLALAPDFASSHWVYMYYAVPAGGVRKISRFTLTTNDTKLDNASEKVIFQFNYTNQCCHFGGAMDFDKDGNLYWSSGDNTSYNITDVTPYGGSANQDPRTTSSNTNDPRGKIMRVKPIPFPDSDNPTPGPGKTYTIPAGNLKEVWNTTEKDKVLAEIYSMGHRNPFSISVNQKTGMIGVGEANGSNPSQGDDEINVVSKPAYFGWPFLIGDNKAYIPSFWNGKFDPVSKAQSGEPNDGPGNTGAKTLPPAQGSVISTSHGKTAMDLGCHGVCLGWVEAPTMDGGKVNQYLENKLLVAGFRTSEVRVATVDDNGNVTKLETLWASGFAPGYIMRAAQGPDGSYYVGTGAACCNFNDNIGSAKIYRFAYKGTCLVPVSSTKVSYARVAQAGAGTYMLAHLGPTKVEIPAGIKRVEAYGLTGKKVWMTTKAGFDFIPASVPRGMLELRYFEN